MSNPENMFQNSLSHTQPTPSASHIKIARPIIDPVLAPILEAFPIPDLLDLNILRGTVADEEENAFIYNADTILTANLNLKHSQHSIPGPDHNTITLSVFTPQNPPSSTLPAFYHIHGGGMVSGDRFSALTEVMKYLEGIECVVVSVEYRLAPETRAPGGAEDCYAGLVWISEHALDLGIDAAEIVVYGLSGGGALAAATCLMVRDRKAFAAPIKGLMLHTPMLDDRCDSVSDQQFQRGSPWSGTTNHMAWSHVLGEHRGTERVTPYQAPSRATDLSSLPPTYIDAAECEVFRDPAVMFASTMWRCGSTCELHIWPGGWHIFDMLDENSFPLVHAAAAAKRAWLKRMIGGQTS